jgi:hypothetical protein
LTYVKLFNEKENPVDVISTNKIETYGIGKSTLQLFWNVSTTRFVGNCTYLLDAGTYTLSISRTSTGLDTAYLSLELKDVNGNPLQ